MSHPPDDPSVVRDPYTAWLNLLLAGGILSGCGWALNGLWTYLQLSATMQDFPRPRYLVPIKTYEWIAQAAVVWMGSWLITSPSPLHDPRTYYTYKSRLGRARGRIIRLLRSAIFIVVSLQVWGVLGRMEPGSLLAWISFGVSGFDSIATMLVWSQAASLSGHFHLRGMRGRTIAMLAAVLLSDLFFHLIPQTLALLDMDNRLTPNQTNGRNATIVLVSILAALTFAKFAWMMKRDVISPVASSPVSPAGA